MLGHLAGTSLWMDVDRPNDEMDANKHFSLSDLLVDRGLLVEASGAFFEW